MIEFAWETVMPTLAADYATLTKRFTASGLVLRPDRTVLLVDHIKFRNWIYPGGRVKSTETPDEAVKREVFEETGLRVELLGTSDFDLDDAQADVTVLHTPYVVLREKIESQTEPEYYVDLVYVCAVSPQDRNAPTRHNPQETKAARFVSREEANQLPMFRDFRNLLVRVFEDDRVWAIVADYDKRHA